MSDKVATDRVVPLLSLDLIGPTDGGVGMCSVDGWCGPGPAPQPAGTQPAGAQAAGTQPAGTGA